MTSAETAHLIADPDFRVGKVDPHLFGSFANTWAGPYSPASTMART